MTIPRLVPKHRIRCEADCATEHGYPCNCDRRDLAAMQSFIVAWATIATIIGLALAAAVLK